jgi:hypothetical protein
MGIAALREGATNDRTDVGRRNRLETPTPFTSRRDAEERFNRQKAAENIVASLSFIRQDQESTDVW